MPQTFTLASASPARKAVLERAGVSFQVHPARVDEDELKHSLKAEGLPARNIAEALAEAKAVKVSQRLPNDLVLGGDQILVCNGVMFDKPRDRDNAAGHLTALSGKWHQLETALVLAEDGKAVWRNLATAKLKMRTLSPDFIQAYLSQIGEAALSSVGAYQLEGVGAQLFEKIEGDFFTILGLPLLPVLQQLRLRAMVPS